MMALLHFQIDAVMLHLFEFLFYLFRGCAREWYFWNGNDFFDDVDSEDD